MSKILKHMLMMAFILLSPKSGWAVMDILADISTAANIYTEKLIGLQEGFAGIESIENLKKISGEVDKVKEMAEVAQQYKEDIEEGVAVVKKAKEDAEALAKDTLDKYNEISSKVESGLNDAKQKLKEFQEEVDTMKEVIDEGKQFLNQEADSSEEGENSTYTDMSEKDYDGEENSQNSYEEQLTGAIGNIITNEEVSSDGFIERDTEKEYLQIMKEKAALEHKKMDSSDSADDFGDSPKKVSSKEVKTATDSIKEDEAVAKARTVSLKEKQKISQEAAKSAKNINQVSDVVKISRHISAEKSIGAPTNQVVSDVKKVTESDVVPLKQVSYAKAISAERINDEK